MFFSLCKEVFFKEEGKGLVLVPLMVDIMILVTSNSFFSWGGNGLVSKIGSGFAATGIISFIRCCSVMMIDDEN